MYKIIISTVIITITVIIFVVSSFRFQENNKNINTVIDNDIISDDNTHNDYIYSIYDNEDIEILLRTLSIPEEFRNIIFINHYEYTLDYIYNVLYKGINEININEEIFKDFLNQLNVNMSNKYQVSNVTKMQVNDEYKFCNSITDDYIDELPNNTFEDGYNRFIYRHSKDSLPILTYKDVYKNNIVYIFETVYNKYYFQIVIEDDKIEDIKVLSE